MNRLLAIALSNSGVRTVSELGLLVARHLNPATLTWCYWRPPRPLEFDSIPLSIGECPLGGSSILLSMSMRAGPDDDGDSLPPDAVVHGDARLWGVDFLDVGTVTDPAPQFAHRTRVFDLILLERGADHDALARFLDLTDRPVLLIPSGATRYMRIVLRTSRSVPSQSLYHWGRRWSEWLVLPEATTMPGPLDSARRGADTDLTLVDRRDIPRKWWSLERGLRQILRDWPGSLCILPGASSHPVGRTVWSGSTETGILESDHSGAVAGVRRAGPRNAVR